MSSVKRTSALTALINETEARNGWSDPDVARWATQQGHRLTKSDISLYRNAGMPTLVPEKIKALAAGLRIAPYLVAVAALADVDIAVPLDRATPETAVETDHTLPAEDRDFILALLDRARGKPPPRPQRRRRGADPDQQL